jgi:hypothetical protein
MLKEVVDFLLICSKFYPDMFGQMVAIFRGHATRDGSQSVYAQPQSIA